MTAAAKETLKDIEIEYGDGVDCLKVAEKIGKYGAAILRGYIKGHDLELLKNEVIMMAEAGHHVYSKGDSIVSSYEWRHITEQKFPQTRKFMRTPFVRKIAEEFFGQYETMCASIRSLYYRNAEVGNEHWHIDPTTSLKYFVYLNDIDQGNGCTEYSLGSHKEGFLRRLHHHTACNVVNDPNRLALRVDDADIVSSSPIEAEAGSVLIFNPNGYHRAGVIQPGRERIILAAYYCATGAMLEPEAARPDVLSGVYPEAKHDALLGFPPNVVDAMTHPRNLPRTYYYKQG
jgi:hypothetical protein